MILGEGGRSAVTAATTLDDLFRRAGVRHPDALALADPPNRERFTDGAPRALSFARADRAISALASRLRALGLQTDAVVALQLPNIVESIVALLGVLRAGMIAVPVPLLWRQHDLVAALGRIGAKAIVTSSRIGSSAPAEIATLTAVELFPIRHVCSFGRNLPDGIVPLDDIFASDSADSAPAPTRPGSAAAHVAAITFGLDAHGHVPIARNHAELLAGGMAVILETGVVPDTPLLSTIPLGSFAGTALTVVPWLLSGGALHLHHGFDPDAFAAQSDSLGGGAVMLPAPALSAITDAGLLRDIKQVVALWRSPDRMVAAKPWIGEPVLVDVPCFGDIGLIAARRGTDGLPASIPHGVVSAPRGALGPATVIETGRGDAGTLTLRGPMVPAQAFPPGAERSHEPHLAPDQAGYVDTGFACRLDTDTQTLTVTAPPAGTAAVGGYRFYQNEVDALVAQADPNATIVALPDADLGQRLAGSAADRATLRAELQARGINPLIAGAFRPRGTAEAA